MVLESITNDTQQLAALPNSVDNCWEMLVWNCSAEHLQFGQLDVNMLVCLEVSKTINPMKARKEI